MLKKHLYCSYMCNTAKAFSFHPKFLKWLQLIYKKPVAQTVHGMLPTHLEIHNVPGNVPDCGTKSKELKLVMYADDVIVYVMPPETRVPADTTSQE